MAAWFRLLGIPFVGTIDLDQLTDEEATWIAIWKVNNESFEEEALVDEYDE